MGKKLLLFIFLNIKCKLIFGILQRLNFRPGSYFNMCYFADSGYADLLEALISGTALACV